VDLRDRVRPIRVDAEAVEIADDKERRVLQREGVLLELREGGVQVFPLALVFPSEMAALPNVGPTLAPGRLSRAALEGEPIAGGVGIGWRWFAKHGAQVIEMRLRRRALV
jgi:hypothetical protein